jgi:4-amino-4-deoxy-L-arabinose transferase-like glycosyltransferase
MSLIPIGDIAYRLNLLSAIFGALTILFLFLAINLLVKNEILSLISSFIFAFIISYWQIANRFELDSLNTFLIALVIFSSFLYNEKKTGKYLYFCLFCLGFSLTDHPIALFIMPALLLYNHHSA